MGCVLSPATNRMHALLFGCKCNVTRDPLAKGVPSCSFVIGGSFLQLPSVEQRGKLHIKASRSYSTDPSSLRNIPMAAAPMKLPLPVRSRVRQL